MSNPAPTIPEPEPLPRPEPFPPSGPDLPIAPPPKPKPGEPVPLQRDGASGGGIARESGSASTTDAEMRIVRRRGDFLLVRFAEGFVWTLQTRTGETWYWHPAEQQWTLCPCGCATPEAASLGINHVHGERGWRRPVISATKVRPRSRSRG